MDPSPQNREYGYTPLLIGVVTAIWLILFVIYPLYFGPYSHVPGPKPCKISRYYILWYDVMLKRNDMIAKWHEKYGPIVCFAPGEVSFSGAEQMREIYGTSGKYTKGNFFENFKAYGELPIFGIGPYWAHRKKRMLIASFYHKSTITRPLIEELLRPSLGKMLTIVDRELSRSGTADSSKSGLVDLYPLFNCFAFDNITTIVFGSRYGSKTLDHVDCPARRILVGIKQAQMWGPVKFNFSILTSVVSFILSAFPERLSSVIIPTSLRLCLCSESELMKWNWNTIQAALADSEHGIEDHTLLKRLLDCKEKQERGKFEGNDDNGEAISMEYIASELFDNINAAQETVAAGLVYLFFYLGRNIDWQRRLREELRALPPADDKSGDILPSWTDIDRAPLLEAFLRESLRIKPGASGRQERYVQDGKKPFAGICLPPGTRVSASTIALHWDRAVFNDPHEFRPERWLGSAIEENGKLQQQEKNFIPFGYGARICLGKALALMELKMMVASMLLRYAVETPLELGDGETGPMWQTGSMEAVPIGLKCTLRLAPLAKLS
jgi:hypothetical protein